MSGSRITPQYVARLAEQLSDRDRAVIDTLARVRLATGDQLQRLHADGTSPLARSRQARRLLQRLTELRLLSRLERRIGGVRSGSAGFVYALDVAGQRLAETGGPAHGRRLRRPWTPSWRFVAHTLAVTELFVVPTEAERTRDFRLEGFEAEPACWRHYPGPGGGIAWCKPDAAVVVSKGELEGNFFVEVDLGTESRPALRRKFETYRRYHAAGIEQRLRGVFPRVLWLTTTEDRAEVLVEVAAGMPAESWPLFQVGLLDRAAQLLTSLPDV